MQIDAFYLPAFASPPTESWSFEMGDGGMLELRVPRLTPQLLTRQVDELITARQRYLAERPVLDIVTLIDRVAARFLDPGDELRLLAEAGIGTVTGLSEPMVQRIIDGMAKDWRRDRLVALLEAEFGDPRVLDEFVAGSNERTQTRAHGSDLTVHIFSGNVPGVSVTSLIRSLLVKSATLGKSAVSEPVFAPLFARGLHDEHVGVGSCVAVTYWTGGNEALEAAAMERADVVVAYGSDEAINDIRPRTPRGSRFLGYGSRVSFGVIARDALTQAGAVKQAKDAALAVATFDQQGCVSPHLFYVEEGGKVSPSEWARLLANAMSELEGKVPRGQIPPGDAAAIRQLRGETEFAQLVGRGYEMHSSDGTEWTVIYDPSSDFAPSCLNRVVRIKPIESLDVIPRLIAPIAAVLQTVGVAGQPKRIESLAIGLARLGASRITPISHMAWPPPTWHHDGRPPLLDMVRWTDWEK